MSFSKTKYLRKKVLDHFYGRNAYAFPSDVWLALFTADPTDDGLLTNELTNALAPGYARVALAAFLSDAGSENGTIFNSATITFTVAGSDWPEVTHGATMDAATSGNMLHFGALTSSRIIAATEAFTMTPGQLMIREQ
jgi:hypothetical protein